MAYALGIGVPTVLRERQNLGLWPVIGAGEQIHLIM
jgi:hypothetical protein